MQIYLANHDTNKIHIFVEMAFVGLARCDLIIPHKQTRPSWFAPFCCTQELPSRPPDHEFHILKATEQLLLFDFYRPGMVWTSQSQVFSLIINSKHGAALTFFINLVWFGHHSLGNSLWPCPSCLVHRKPNLNQFT